MSHRFAGTAFRFIVLLAASLLLLPLPAAPAAESPQAAAAKARAATLTNSLLQLHDRYRRAPAADKPQLLADLAGVAAQRRAALLALVDGNPAAVLRLAVPPATRASLPPAIQAQVEAYVDVQGVLTVRYEDYRDRARLRHILQANGRRYNLHFSGRPPDLLSGSRVRVRALQLSAELLLESGGTSSTTMLQVTAPALSNTFGEIPTAVLLVNFQDNGTQPFSVTQAWNAVLGIASNSANDYFREASYQQASLAGNVYGWYTLPLASTTCNEDAIATAARAAASAAGVDLSPYRRLLYVFPKIAACAWVGMGMVGGNPAEAWINGTLNPQVVTHEMGHNFGLYHSHALECGTATVGTTCSNDEYGDWLDTMGNRYIGHYNAFQKERLGWLNYGASPPLVVVQNGGSFGVESYETASAGPKALKVFRATDPATGRKSWYYVEYRRAAGFDGFIANRTTNVLTGVVLHSATDGLPDSSALLDATPGSTTYYSPDWDDLALGVGQSFTDAGAGLTITTTSAGGTTAGVSVSYGTAACTRAAPGLALSPSQSATVAPGTVVAYTLTVTNNDSSACSPTQFSLSGTVPSGWSGSLAASTLTLAPGARGATSLAVTSPASTPVGIYGISATAGTATPATASYVVGSSTTTTATANQPPVAANDTAATVRNTPVRVAVLANDRDPEGQPLTVVGVSPPGNGTAAINGDGTVTYTPRSNFKGSDSFSYTVSDGSNRASATVGIQVKQK